MSGKSTKTVDKNTSSFLKRGIRNFLFSGIGTISTFIIGFLFAGITIRYLGEARAGYFMALTALTGLNIFLGDFGLSTPAIRRVAILNSQNDLSTARAVIGSVSMASFFSSLIIFLPLIILFPYIFSWTRLDLIYKDDAFWATVFTMASFVINQITSPWKATYSALEKYGLISSLNTIFGFLSGFSGIVVLIVIPTMTSISVTRFVFTIFHLIADAYFMKKLLKKIPWPTWVWNEIKPMINFGSWVYMGTIGNTLLNRLNSIIITSFLGSAALPYFEFPQRIFRQVHGIISAQSQILLPMLSSFGKGITNKIQLIEDKLRWIVAISSAIIYMTIALIGPFLLGKIVNQNFAYYATVPLYLACLQGFFQAQDIVLYYSSWAIGVGKPNAVMDLLQGLLVALTGIYLIPKFGVLGASLAQEWVIFIVVFHIIWIQRIMYPEKFSWQWFRCYVSPSIMLGIWAVLIFVFRHFFQFNNLLLIILSFLSGVFCFIIMVYFEKIFYPDMNRIEIIFRLFRIVFNSIQNKLPFLKASQVIN